ncbi:hypothetical protein KB20921_21800 [Edwardsiella ictaluri]|nr:hypothetical protein KH20906_21580 [Edwardsiella ictaluri]BEI02919.1 hypothetical protein KB20921_21800 [Edwardsiella ictaluri]BEI06380.1 hypothetical protein KH201010_21660 [Edwardsiella ictaluri]BEI09844.1 hypothetical protein STU22726_21750 [Edwardsiella ictaluri]BEI13323.1 hypothetical protein STU22816_21760 [Edwardsiella ictaluri]
MLGNSGLAGPAPFPNTLSDRRGIRRYYTLSPGELLPLKVRVAGKLTAKAAERTNPKRLPALQGGAIG